MRDWLFSRQRYWGEPIPIIHYDYDLKPLDESELPLELPAVEKYEPTGTGESPLANIKEWVEIKNEEGEVVGLRETNTMPQWAGSCWYYLRYIDPQNSAKGWATDKESYWMPVDLYVGGAEHAVLHLLYARFWHKVLYDRGIVSTSEPFQKLFHQGLILAFAYEDQETGVKLPADEVEEREDGKYVHVPTGKIVNQIVTKMSKSLRNVVNPDEVVGEHGADTLRLYEMFMGPLDVSKPWNTRDVPGISRFLNRCYRLIVDADDGMHRSNLSEGGEEGPPELEVLAPVHSESDR